eukprot:m.28371 g.28371  ORF g.28371 m.28371 type:complete len:261 (-) comp40141_c0_seq1:136-918(-)
MDDFFFGSEDLALGGDDLADLELQDLLLMDMEPFPAQNQFAFDDGDESGGEHDLIDMQEAILDAFLPSPGAQQHPPAAEYPLVSIKCEDEGMLDMPPTRPFAFQGDDQSCADNSSCVSEQDTSCCPDDDPENNGTKLRDCDRFSPELLTMSLVQFNRYVRYNPMPSQELADLRKARRRIKNRGYSKKHRDNMKNEVPAATLLRTPFPAPKRPESCEKPSSGKQPLPGNEETIKTKLRLALDRISSSQARFSSEHSIPPTA